MSPWPHTTITFVSTDQAHGHVPRIVLINDTPVAVEEYGIEISQPESKAVQRVTITLLPTEMHFIQRDDSASTETAQNGDLSDDSAGQEPARPPRPARGRVRAILTRLWRRPSPMRRTARRDGGEVTP